MSSEIPIDEILRKRRIIITCGTGGVGKTTLSAAMALRAAMLGKKAVVITIDPAKRLATSLGLKDLGDDPTDLTERLEKITGHIRGSLHAIVPDTKKTFELFVKELSPNLQVQKRVLENPIFQIFSKEFSGANEYMSLERLFALDKQREYDCIILDTPPSRNTLAFLEAPKLLARLFEERLIKWLVVPANRIVAAGMKKALSLLEKMTGAGFMTHLVDFATSLFEVQGSFTQNLKSITALLESDAVGFVMVAAPSPELVPEVEHFIASLSEHHFHFDGVALNRTLGYLKNPPASEIETRDSSLQKAVKLVEALQAREARTTSKMSRNWIAKLPELSRDVHSVEDLFHVAQAFDSASAP
jgi:anion-transporting  ArsA/GET3 family ATPase